MNFKLNERIKVEVSIVDIIDMDKNIIYVFNDKDGNTLMFETLKKHKPAYDKSFAKTNKLSVLIDFINDFNQKVVISNLRFLK